MEVQLSGLGGGEEMYCVLIPCKPLVFPMFSQWRTYLNLKVTDLQTETHRNYLLTIMGLIIAIAEVSKLTVY